MVMYEEKRFAQTSNLRSDVDVFSERSLRRRRHLSSRRFPEVGGDAFQLRHRLLLQPILKERKKYFRF
jgi:hypothetical protein